jgi:hypothetical protein
VATNLSSRSSEEELRASNAGNAQVRLLSGGPALDGSAEWSASGPENRGDLTVRGSIPQPSAIFLLTAEVPAARECARSLAPLRRDDGAVTRPRTWLIPTKRVFKSRSRNQFGQAGHWRAQGAVNAPHMLWRFDSVSAHHFLSQLCMQIGTDAAVAQWQSTTLPTWGRWVRFPTGRSKCARVVIVVDTSA